MIGIFPGKDGNPITVGGVFHILEVLTDTVMASVHIRAKTIQLLVGFKEFVVQLMHICCHLSCEIQVSKAWDLLDRRSAAGQFHLDGSSLAKRKQSPPPRCCGGVRVERLDKLKSCRHQAGGKELSTGQFHLDGSSLAIRKQTPTPPALRGVRVERLDKLRSRRHRAGAKELSAGQFHLDGSSLAKRKQSPPPAAAGCPSGETRKIKELPPSSWRQGTVHRTVPFRWFESRHRKQNPTLPALRGCGVLVRVARLELAASWSQTRRPTNWATPGN